LPENGEYPPELCGIKFEIQMRSSLQHTWAEIEHDLGYKSMYEVPREVRREFSRIAGLLELADESFVRIRSKIADYNKQTTENIKNVCSDGFLKGLSERGCKAVIFVEFDPVTDDAVHLAPGDEQREYLAGRLESLREQMPEMVFVSFPGDEKSSGGCLAAGRGFST
jgi:hypothetical protein